MISDLTLVDEGCKWRMWACLRRSMGVADQGEWSKKGRVLRRGGNKWSTVGLTVLGQSVLID